MISLHVCTKFDDSSFSRSRDIIGTRKLKMGHATLTTRDGGISSISTNRKSNTRFLTLPLSPPKGGTKRDFAVFASKIQTLSKKVCYKVSLYENVQQHSCSYIIRLSNCL